MAKTKRLTLALSVEVDDALNHISSLTGKAKSGIINELMQDTLPVLIQISKALEEAKLGKTKAAIETTAKFLSEVTGELNQAQIEFEDLKGKHGK